MEANRLDIENLTKAEAQQKALIAQYQNRLNLTPVREQQLAGILRDEELSKKDYADLLDKEQQSQLAMSLEKQQGGQQFQFRLVEPPSLPDIPSSPNRVTMSLMGMGAGLALGLLIAIASDLARPTFHTVKEVSQRFGAPLVIGLPVVTTQRENSRRKWKRTFEWMGEVGTRIGDRPRRTVRSLAPLMNNPHHQRRVHQRTMQHPRGLCQ